MAPVLQIGQINPAVSIHVLPHWNAHVGSRLQETNGRSKGMRVQNPQTNGYVIGITCSTQTKSHYKLLHWEETLSNRYVCTWFTFHNNKEEKKSQTNKFPDLHLKHLCHLGWLTEAGLSGSPWSITDWVLINTGIFPLVFPLVFYQPTWPVLEANKLFTAIFQLCLFSKNSR